MHKCPSELLCNKRIYFSFPCLILAFLICITSYTAYCQTENIDIQYVKTVIDERSEKNEDFKAEEKSPLDTRQRKKFKELNYYEVDEKFKINASYSEYEVKEQILMPTTTDRLPLYLKYAELSFELDGKLYELQVYQNVDLSQKPGFEDYLFIPFTDKSNGFGSYGGGRYLDIRRPALDNIVLDFNKSYNPYCAYNHKYSCPIPPEENHLDIEIPAGEKAFK